MWQFLIVLNNTREMWGVRRGVSDPTWTNQTKKSDTGYSLAQQQQ